MRQDKSLISYHIMCSGELRSKQLDFRVLISRNDPSCPAEIETLIKTSVKQSHLQWKITAPGSTALVPCPIGYNGYVKRDCRLKQSHVALWGTSDYSFCVNQHMLKINMSVCQLLDNRNQSLDKKSFGFELTMSCLVYLLKLQNAKNGYGDWKQVSSVQIMMQVSKYLDEAQILYPGEGEQVIGMMEDIINYDLYKGKVRLHNYLYYLSLVSRVNVYLLHNTSFLV